MAAVTSGANQELASDRNGKRGYIVRASMPYNRPPYSRPFINTYEHLLPDVPPSDQL